MEVSHNKFSFKKCYDRQTIEKKVNEIANEINAYYKKLLAEQENPKVMLVCTLKGAFMFYADLVRQIEVPSQPQFIKASSYDGFQSTGKVKFQLVISPQKIKGKHILVIQDIIDTGKTLKEIVNLIKQSEPKSVQICTLFQRPNKQYAVNVRFKGFQDERFIIGYGIDYDSFGRTLPEIYVKKDQE